MGHSTDGQEDQSIAPEYELPYLRRWYRCRSIHFLGGTDVKTIDDGSTFLQDLWIEIQHRDERYTPDDLGEDPVFSPPYLPWVAAICGE